MRKLITLLLLCMAVSAAFGSPRSYALSCAGPLPPVKEYETSDAVFHGTATQKKDDSFGTAVTFAIEESWKGTGANGFIQVYVSSMWMDVATGKEYLIYAKQDKGKLSANLCGNTKLWEAGQAESALFPGESKPPAQAAVRYPPMPWFIPAGAAAVTLAGIAAGLFIRRSRMRK